MGDAMKILVVCHGNINRSPLVAAAIRSGATHRNLPWEVRSVGMKARGGPATPKMRAYASSVLLDLSKHRSRLITADDCAWADIVLYMDSGNERRLRREWTEHIDKCFNLAGWIGEKRIPDPHYETLVSEFNKKASVALRAAQVFVEKESQRGS